MTSPTQTAPQQLVTVDDYLGPGERRFFGKGYKRAEQELTGIGISQDTDGNGMVRAHARVTYPSDWSRKGKTDQRPHLSSIDALLVAGELADLFLAHALRLGPGERSRARWRRVVLKAGNAPVEEELTGFAVSAAVTATDTGCAVDGMQISKIDCHVGAMRVRGEIEHPVGTRHAMPGFYDDPQVLLGPAHLRPYAHAHKAKTQLITDLNVDVDALRADAALDVATETGDPISEAVGLESYSHRGTSLIDAFVASIQLGQILLYAMDEVDRANSNTLWMRQTVLEVTDPHQVTTGTTRFTTRLEDMQLLTDKDAQVWRTGDITAGCDNLTVTCSVAHRLPNGGSPRA
jgi:hypothetical protein